MYQVSDCGRIRSFSDRKNGKILTPIKKDGYLRVGLHKNLKCKVCYIHRLVAEAFVANPYDFKIINHIDENKENNIASNLEWCTIDYNVKYSQCKAVMQFDLNGSYMKTFNSIKEAKKEVGDHKISEVCKGKRKSAGGYIWRYSF